MKNKHTYTFISTHDSITVFIDNEPLTAQSDHPNYSKIVNVVKKGNKSPKKLKKLFDMVETVINYVGNNISVTSDGVFRYKGKIIDNVLCRQILDMMKQGFNIDPMVKFLNNLQDNPSYAAQQELMLFLEDNNLPITDDGHLLAYKSVANDYTDYHSGTFDNSIGAICEMDRKDVDDDRRVTCSNGLHAASLRYAGSFGGADGHLMVIKINPRDVVSIPYDYNNEKMRCCRYEVIGEVPMSTTAKDEYNTVAVYGVSFSDDEDEYEDDWE